MKRILLLLLCAMSLLFSACTGEETITFTGTVLEIAEGGTLLVATGDDVGFDKASVSMSLKKPLPFNIIVGESYVFEILPQIAESYPVQVTAVAVAQLPESTTTD